MRKRILTPLRHPLRSKSFEGQEDFEGQAGDFE